MRENKIAKSDWLKGLSIANDGTIVLRVPYKECSGPVRVFRDYEAYDIYVDAMELPEFPTDGNPRGINPLSASFKGVVKTVSSLDTLLQDNHKGGVAFANHVVNDKEKKEMVLTFSSTEMGLVDGATSHGAILYARFIGALKSGHMMKITVRDYNSDKLTQAQRLVCVEQAANLNSMVAQKDEDLCFKKGYFDSFLDNMSSEYRKMFIFKPNAQEPELNKQYSSTMLIRLLEAMHLKKYPYNGAPICINKGIGGLIKGFSTEMDEGRNPYGYLLPLLNDFIALYGHILYHWDDGMAGDSKYNELIETLGRSHNKVFKTPYSCIDPQKYSRNGYVSSQAHMWAVFQAYRANLIYDEVTERISWRVDPYLLWSRCNSKLWRKVYNQNAYTCQGNAVNYPAHPECWAELYDEVLTCIEDIERENRERYALEHNDGQENLKVG